MEDVTVGADPEVFVIDILTQDVEASQGVVKGDKDMPFPTDNGFIHRDNVLAEMNVIPAMTAVAFAKNVNGILSDLTNMLKSSGKEVGVLSSHIMAKKYLQHYEAARFGCNANENCWHLDRIYKPSAQSAGALRTASGHIHIGCEHTSEDAQTLLAQSCELHMGLPSIAFDQDSRRRELYGVAGSFRRKEYGIEYTVLSNFWLLNSERMRWIFDRAIESVANVKRVEKVSTDMAEAIQNTINNCDIQEAQLLCKHLGIDFPEVA